MTHTIVLDPETETIIARRAKRRGMTVAAYVAHLANIAARKHVAGNIDGHRNRVDVPSSKLQSSTQNFISMGMFPQLTEIGDADFKSAEYQSDDNIRL